MTMCAECGEVIDDYTDEKDVHYLDYCDDCENPPPLDLLLSLDSS